MDKTLLRFLIFSAGATYSCKTLDFSAGAKNLDFWPPEKILLT